MQQQDKRYDVFISYKRENISFVSKVSKELANPVHDINAWVDLEKLHREPSKDYIVSIHKAIENAKLFLLVYTKEIEGSDFIINEELAYAFHKNKPLFVFPQDSISKNSRILEYVGKLQWLDTKDNVRFQTDIADAIHDSGRFTELSRLTGHGFTVYDDQNVFLIRIALQRELGKITPFGNYLQIASSDQYYKPNLIDIKIAPKSFFLDIPKNYLQELKNLGFIQVGRNKEITELLKEIDVDEEEILSRLLSFIERHYKPEKLQGWLIQYKQKNYEDLSALDIPSAGIFSAEVFVDVVKQITACFLIRDLKEGKVLFNGSELGVENIVEGRTEDTEEHWAKISLYYSDYFTFKTLTEIYHILSSIDENPFVAIKEKGLQISEYAPFLCSLGLGGFVVAYQEGSPYLMWTKRSEKISSGDMWHFSYDETVSLLKDAIRNNGKIALDNDKYVTIDAGASLSRAIREEIGIPEHLLENVHSGLFEIGLIQSERLEIELISNVTVHLRKEEQLKATFKQWHDSSSDGYLEISKIDFVLLNDTSELVGRLLSPEALSAREKLASRVFERIGRDTIIGEGTIIETGSFIDDGAIVGKKCKIHRNVYIGDGVRIGDYCKIQNNNSIYHGVTLEDGVFVGTNVCFTNDLYPRAILRNGKQVGPEDWELKETLVKRGASIGAGAVIRCGITIGEWAMIGCGAVVLNDVPAGATVVGNPARIIQSKEILH